MKRKTKHQTAWPVGITERQIDRIACKYENISIFNEAWSLEEYKARSIECMRQSLAAGLKGFKLVPTKRRRK